jgi:hypothetical protein
MHFNPDDSNFYRLFLKPHFETLSNGCRGWLDFGNLFLLPDKSNFLVLRPLLYEIPAQKFVSIESSSLKIHGQDNLDPEG